MILENGGCCVCVCLCVCVGIAMHMYYIHTCIGVSVVNCFG